MTSWFVLLQYLSLLGGIAAMAAITIIVALDAHEHDVPWINKGALMAPKKRDNSE